MFPYVHKFKQLSHGNGDPSVIGPVRNFSELQLKKYCCEQTIAAVFILFYFLSLTESHSHEYIQRCKYSDAQGIQNRQLFLKLSGISIEINVLLHQEGLTLSGGYQLDDFFLRSLLYLTWQHCWVCRGIFPCAQPRHRD